MKPRRTLGESINRGFAATIIILGTIMAIRFAVAVVRHDVEHIEWRPEHEGDHEGDNFVLYPETQDDLGETANGLDVPRSMVDTSVDEAYVNGFFK
jgi:hypothetical protein